MPDTDNPVASKPCISLPPIDCTDNCSNGPCDCSGKWRDGCGRADEVAALRADLKVADEHVRSLVGERDVLRAERDTEQRRAERHFANLVRAEAEVERITELAPSPIHKKIEMALTALKLVVKHGETWSYSDEARDAVFDALGWRDPHAEREETCPKCNRDTTWRTQSNDDWHIYECWCEECHHEWKVDIRVG